MEFAVIGGDVRQRYLADLLKEDGHNVTTAAIGLPGDSLAEAVKAENVILPLPACVDGVMLHTPLSGEKMPIRYVFAAMRPGSVVFAGKADLKLATLAAEAGVALEDYFAREDFTVKNAALTAEGAVGMLMRERLSAVAGMNCLVIGYGRIGKFAAAKLKALGANVTVSARKNSDMAWIECSGYTPADTRRIEGILKNFDAVINTVPAMVLDHERLAELRKDCLCIDLASSPGGTDFKAAAELGLKAMQALGLPGKLLPESAAMIVRDTIYSIVSERGNK